MMDFLFVILVFLTISFMAAQRNRQLDEQIAKRQKMIKCPPHKWEYLTQPGSGERYMQCTQCGTFPGGRSGEQL